MELTKVQTIITKERGTLLTATPFLTQIQYTTSHHILIKEQQAIVFL